MGFLTRRNDRGIISGGVMLHDLARSWFPDLTDVLWKDVLPDSRMYIKVNDDAVIVKFAFAGCKPANFDVESSATFLTVKVAKREKIPMEDCMKHYSCNERLWGEYQESVKLPVPVIAAEAKAKYFDGILEITLPRSKNGECGTKQVQVN